MLKRTWQEWGNRAKLMAPMYRYCPRMFVTHRLLTHEPFPEVADPERPLLQPYEGLAEHWHEYTRSGQPDYASYLGGLKRIRGTQTKSVLDLACGTGTLMAQLSEMADHVVGVDASEAMLARARTHCAGRPGAEVRRGDFRSLQLDRKFDVAVCAFNSLNYLNDIRELEDVFAGVHRHLHPGGLFVFDTITLVGMQNIDGAQIHYETCGVRWELHFTFDHHDRKEVAVAAFPTGIELHHRVPISPEDVIPAARKTGFGVDEYFSHALIPGRWLSGGYSFFVLSKPN